MASEELTPWPRWFAPAIVVGMCSAAYGVGLFNGENRNAPDIARLATEMAAHQAVDVHTGAVRIDLYRVQIATLENKIDRLQAQMTRIEELLLR